MATHRNRLADETSPYLLQHARNPVDWYPWGPEALARARQEDKPILLSIGYSACHWCHVMAHESFDDEATAQVLNANFVNVKVDREERPDLDRIYQLAHQLLARRAGGWPLTVFLTPDQTPFFAGTYFPKEPRYGLPGFAEVAERVAAFFREHTDDVVEVGESLRAALAQMDEAASRGAPGRLNDAPLRKARAALAESYDAQHGGFGDAPKFPQAGELALLLRLGAAGDGEAMRMALHTLHAMADGGLYDHIGGGFFRYAVDAQWTIPHFEKMLYDNALLMPLYAQAHRISGDARLREVAERTGEWVLSEMESPAGGFYSTLDADSEGHEGRYYVWTREEVRAVLSPEDVDLALALYGLDLPPNFEGRWHLQRHRPFEELTASTGLSVSQLVNREAAIRIRLAESRRARPRPGRDEKQLTAWNGLMIAALANTGRWLDRPDFIAAAEGALDFVRSHLLRDGSLLAVWNGREARLTGYLDDYAFVMEGLLALLQARWRDGDLSFALTLADRLLDGFEDESIGGFFFTADNHEPLLHRPKDFADESLPSGNGAAASVLIRLGHLVGRLEFGDAAERALRAAWPSLSEHPVGHGAVLLALHESLQPSPVVVVRATPGTAVPWQALLHECVDPRRIDLLIPADAMDLPGKLAERRAQNMPVAYICRDTQCRPPISDVTALRQELQHLVK